MLLFFVLFSLLWQPHDHWPRTAQTTEVRSDICKGFAANHTVISRILRKATSGNPNPSPILIEFDPSYLFKPKLSSVANESEIRSLLFEYNYFSRKPVAEDDRKNASPRFDNHITVLVSSADSRVSLVDHLTIYSAIDFSNYSAFGTEIIDGTNFYKLRLMADRQVVQSELFDFYGEISSEGHLEKLLSCRREEQVPIPHCRIDLKSGNLHILIGSLRKTEIEQLSTIVSSALDFSHCIQRNERL